MQPRLGIPHLQCLRIVMRICAACDYSSPRRIWSSFGLCFALRPVRGLSGSTREGFGWPTRSRALAFTAFAAEKTAGLRFAMAKLSME